MAGIYVHIPFCKTHCSYCDFYSIIDEKKIDVVIESICQELVLRKEYLGGELIETIYFGGGTPSYVSTEFLEKILQKIKANYVVSEIAEITLEVNPDDIYKEKAEEYLNLGFNRVSVGIQSYNDLHLKFLNRRHDANQAINVIEILKKAGFSNISIDLIYGIPGMTPDEWKKNVEQAIIADVKHISAYHLTIEKGTELFSQLKKGKITLVSDIESEDNYITLCELLKKNKFEHYEISNFSKPGFKSKHNTSYWEGKKYVGFGPAAHSFNGLSRQWNVSNTNEYMDGIKKNEKYFIQEKLSKKNRYNEYILTGLRTNEGVYLSKLRDNFGNKYQAFFLQQIEKHLKNEHLVEKQKNNWIIPEKKWLVSDGLIADLCMV